MGINDLKEEIIHGSILFPFAFYQWQGEFSYLVNLHWHKETEIIYFQTGTFIFVHNMEEYRIIAPALAIVEAGDFHSILLEEGQKESAIVFDLLMLYFEHFDEIQARIMKPLIEKKLQFPSFIFPYHDIWDQVISVYNKTLVEAQKKSLGSYIKIKAYLLELIAIIYENNYMINRETIEVLIPYKVENIKKVLLFIQDNYQKKLTVSQLADLLGMNNQYFCRYFKKITGKTLFEYINKLRIDKATELLLKTNIKILNIALECGYENLAYFNKQFKTLKQMTPQEFRKAYKSV